MDELTAALSCTTLALFNDVSVCVGTAISCPEAIIAFSLLLVKTHGRAVTLNRLVLSKAVTMASRVLPAVKKPVNPLAPAAAICVMFFWLRSALRLRTGAAPVKATTPSGEGAGWPGVPGVVVGVVPIEPP